MDTREYKSLTIPLLNWNQKALNAQHGELIAQPLAPGFGVTLGNALRRVLLGGIEGAAVTSVIIKGVNNEFSSLDGVVEDVMQLVLNIKRIVIRNKTGKPGKMVLNKQGDGVVRAGEIETDKHIEIVNQDHVIAHLSPKGSLQIEFFVENGRGYQQAQWPEKQLQPDDRIYLDAMFSPVQKVSFDVEKTRVGGNIDYDKLTLIIDTNGAETPVSVLHYAVSVLRTQLEHFLTTPEIPFNQLSTASAQPVSAEQVKMMSEAGMKGLPIELLFKPIDELELSVRANNCLLNADITRVLDLVNLTEDEALKIKNFGRKSLNEVKESLAAFGLSFGMNLKESELKKLLKASEEAPE
jgi:DNA-directed RNA polymerase subunit alpha